MFYSKKNILTKKNKLDYFNFFVIKQTLKSQKPPLHIAPKSLFFLMTSVSTLFVITINEKNLQ